VLIPRRAWPTFTCEENGGRGWTATIKACTRGVATVAFTDAATPRGIPYEDAQLRLDFLLPI
jgi:hypothetical protein